MARDGPVGIICIYAPTDHHERSSFFTALVSFIFYWDCRDFINFGNFNVVLSDNERWGSNGFDSALQELVDLVEVFGLQDLPLRGSPFTFLSSGQSKARSQLDRVFISSEAGGWCHNVIHRAYFNLLSDHIPIILSCGNFLFGSRSFRFFNTWCSDADL